MNIPSKKSQEVTLKLSSLVTPEQERPPSVTYGRTKNLRRT